ncbi:MAG TPA: ABC transporter substrate-binding protein [Candidatus Limnocylindria bacterium]
MNHRWKLFTILVVLGLVLAACGTAASPSASSSASGGEPSASEAAFDGMTYPEDAPAECGSDTNASNISQIKAIDRLTVEFTLCNPDVAFLSKIAFSAFGIDDSDYLTAHMEDGSIIEQPNGTGPYKLDAWNRGTDITMSAFDGYWGTAAKSPTVIFRWSTEAAQRLVELQGGTVDGIDNPGPDDFKTIEDDPNLKLYPREGLNTFYIGFNNTFPPFDNEKVRQAIAMGIDRQRIVDAYYPPGSEVATHFTPCSIPFACEGDDWYDYDLDAAKQMLADAGFPNGFETTIHLRDVVRGYLPAPQQVAADLLDQLADLGITATIDVQESTTFIDNANNGALDGIHMLGWGADYPDVTNFLDFHFGAGASPQFGDKFDDITEALQQGASSVEDADRQAAYETANNAVREHVPMVPIAHGGSGVAFQANNDGAHSSPLGNENMSVIGPGSDDQLVWMQNGEPGGLYCGDETDGESLRVCEQIKESLYAYEVAGTAAEPSLATECAPNDDLTVWTCTLRDGVKFHDGADLDANDVVLSYAVQWDAAHPLHIGRNGTFDYFSALFGFLNPPPAE